MCLDALQISSDAFKIPEHHPVFPFRPSKVVPDRLETYPFRHLSAMWIVVVELQHEDRDDHGQAHDHHGAGKVLS